MIQSFFRLAATALVLYCASASCMAAEIKLYAYHLKPPYIIDAEKGIGLYYDLARKLNQVQSQHTYKTYYLPRKRLESLLEQEQLDGLVLGVNPHWFNDASQHRFGWTTGWIKDRDIVVSRSEHPVIYARPDSLIGKRVGLSLGYYYFGVNELADKGQIIRDNSQNESITLEKLVLGRVDAMIITQRTLNHLYKQHPEYMGKLYTAAIPHDTYERMILLPKTQQALVPSLNQSLAKIADDSQWQALLKADQ